MKVIIMRGAESGKNRAQGGGRAGKKRGRKSFFIFFSKRIKKQFTKRIITNIIY